jgi:hypothetical protein
MFKKDLDYIILNKTLNKNILNMKHLQLLNLILINKNINNINYTDY